MTSFQRDILWVLGGLKRPNGTDIKSALEEYMEPPIHHGRLYPNLDELHERGLITKGPKNDRSNEYELTEAGWEELRARRRWEDRLAGTKLNSDTPQP